MKVADERIIRFERSDPAGAGFGAVLDGQAREGLSGGHDARSLIIAVAMCGVCWLGLGYFLLN
ncbi:MULTISPECIES: hypothetical protein [Sphingomonadaceae]|uniref:Uncharacterized protein n=1 Tax=Novosphingobium clariflavum TaxID=2029884 RepID=A0ABV6S6H7_9SPHN|nr:MULTISPECIES: hypothetical protein [Sphingomonadaceae]QDK32949.1 hypothetical protein DM450_09230 [Sphingomonas sp. IC081]QSR18287.1 hypothetical protein CA833_13995 [Novosphingobium sp. KA1]